MNKENIKQLTTILFAWGLGFMLSSVVGSDGIRENVQLQTLIIGGMMMLLATGLRFKINKNKSKKRCLKKAMSLS
ncbi:hypothetical protein [Cellulosilyticum ruminicola]|uniref:hypothetical protein n=1 Tax=Cellulosilyticum ruminicola TaxID=425254 RepID=UPI0006D1A305|nr:hypothetical protein [Cellulosilyticum ruminicola]